MKARIFEILEKLVSMKSVSPSAIEQEPAEWFGEFFKTIPYFKDHPEDCGLYEIPGDAFGRKVPFALVRGKKADTVVLSGHFDVVSTEEYGEAEPYAYQIGNDTLEKMLREMPLTDEARADLESGEWLWGRGVADMKGGLAIHTALLEKYADMALEGTLEGSVLYMPVCDEECYSAGMRAGASVLKELKEKYGLDYKLLIDPEPTNEEGGVQTMSIGSVGKIMPAIIVQTVKGHSGHCFDAFNALNVLSDIYLHTNGSLEFSDVYGDEYSVPPTWANMRDLKKGYDCSVPHRAGGYITVLGYTSTPEDYMNKMKRIAKEAFERQVAKLDGEYQEYKKIHKAEVKEKIYYEPWVVSFDEFCEMMIKEHGDKFTKFYNEKQAALIKAIEEGKSDYPSATMEIMEEVLNFSNIQAPITIIGFAPPYYLPMHADLVKGKENYGTKAFEFTKSISEAEFGQKMTYENFFMGISDLSYSAITAPFDYSKYINNTPLWGDSYNIDFATIEFNAIPGVIYGPIGKNYHQFNERVNKKSLLEVVPAVTQKLIEYMWSL